MKLNTKNIKELIVKMGFAPQNGKNDLYFKSYSQCDSYIIRVDFNAEKIEYYAQNLQKKKRIAVGDGSTSNFSHDENFVILECVDRLLEKGYSPSCIELEKTYPSGRGHSGRLDILVSTPEGQAFLMIECKTWGKEYEKEQKKMLADGGQLFTYYKNAVATRHLCLYSSQLTKNTIAYVNSVVDTQEEWIPLSEIKDIYERWNKTFKNNGIFESYSSPYNVIHKRLTYSDLENMHEEDGGKIYNQIMEILRHNGISDKPNAFNKLLNLFVCKIIDEDKNENDELEFQCWEGLSDEKLQMTLNDLYKEGMWRFLNIEVIDHSMDEITEKLDEVSNEAKKTALINIISDLRLKKSPNFAFVEVLDDKTFKLNAKIVREIVELLQGYKLRYERKHEFLGNFFELLLNTSMKQEAGQFFTPMPIVKFIISSLPLTSFIQRRIAEKSNDPLPAAIDYACGSGHFLTEFMAQLQDVVESIDIQNASPSVKKRFASWRDGVKFSWAKDYVYGIDFDNRLVKTTKVSAFFNGDGEANVIWGNGLDSFVHSSEYRGKLKRTLPENKRNNGQFDIIISNPPYSVPSFRRVLQNGEEAFDLYNGLTDNSSEIECMFVERTMQLLKVGGWAGIILPSSMLSNGGIYARTRDIIFKYFSIKSIVELGSGTFMKTGTNTVVLFLERRPDAEYDSVVQAIDSFFINKRDVTVLGIECAFSKFVTNVYDGLSFDDYVSFLSETATDNFKKHDLWKDYTKDYGDDVHAKLLEVEREKMLYFLLTYDQNIVFVKSGKKQDEKIFLGYEFSERRGQEGIRRLPSGTMLFDESGDIANNQKINSYIHNAFLDRPPLEVHVVASKYILYRRMSSFFEYGTSKFSKRINLLRKGKVILASDKYEVVQLGVIADIRKGQAITAAQAHGGNVPVVAGGLEPSVYHNRANRDADIVSVSASGANAGYIRYWNTAIFASDCTTIKTNNNRIASTKFIFLCLKKMQKDIYSLQSGQAQPHVYEKDLSEIKIPLPPINVQQKIILESEMLAEKITQIKEKITLLRKDVEMEFLRMFGDPILNPMGWETHSLGDFGSLKNGVNYSQHDTGYVMKCLGVSDFGHLYKISDMEEISTINLSSEPSSDYLLKDRDIVFVRSNGNAALVGRCVEVFPHENKVTYSGFCIRYRNESKDLLTSYLNHALHLPSIKAILLDNGNGANIKNLNQQALSSLKIPLPPLQSQRCFEKFVQLIERKEAKAKASLSILKDKYRDILEKYL